MNKILTILFAGISLSAFSQNYYKQISEKKINQERLKVANNFAKDYIDKCKKNDFSKFENYIIDSRSKSKLNDSIKENCNRIIEKYGNFEILDLNSSYYHKYLKNNDALELFIFNFKTEKNPEVKYASVWVYEDKNVIGGLLFSKEKPLKRNSKKKKKL